MLSKIKNYFHNIFIAENTFKKFYTINIIAFFYLLLIAGIISIVLFFIPEQYNEFSTMKQIQNLKKSHSYFINEATSAEKFNRWVELFYGCKYSQSAATRFYRYDCSSAVVKYFRSFGAEVAVENVKDIEKRLLRLYNSGANQLRNRYADVCTGDIVIFKSRGDANHIGVVGYKHAGWICVMDMNGTVDTMGFSYYTFTDNKINFISAVSFGFWAGDVLN